MERVTSIRSAESSAIMSVLVVPVADPYPLYRCSRRLCEGGVQSFENRGCGVLYCEAELGLGAHCPGHQGEFLARFGLSNDGKGCVMWRYVGAAALAGAGGFCGDAVSADSLDRFDQLADGEAGQQHGKAPDGPFIEAHHCGGCFDTLHVLDQDG